MRTVEVLTLLREVLEAHEHHSAEATQVIPVVVEDLDSHREVMAAAIHHAGGVLVFAAEAASGVTGRLDDVLVGRVQAFDLPRPGGESRHLEAREQGPRVIVGIKGSPTGVPGAGDGQLLGVLTTLFDYRLRTTALAFVAWDETDLDRVAAEELWQFMHVALSGVKVGTLNTLVTLVNVQRPGTIHLKRNGSFRWGFVSGRTVRRRTQEATTVDMARLAGDDAPLLVLFLGAGSSFASGLPLGDDLRDRALRTLFQDQEAGVDHLSLRFHEYLKGKGRLLGIEQGLTIQAFVASLTLERVLREEFHEVGRDASPTLNAFARLHATAIEARSRGILAVQRMAQIRKRLVVATVNFDQLIEAGQESTFEVFSSAETFAGCAAYLKEYGAGRADRVPLLKLHGSIEDRSTIVADLEETSYLPLPQDRIEALRALLGTEESPTPVVYVGYSFRDRDVVPALDLLDFARRSREVIVAPWSTPPVEEFIQEHRQHAWQVARRPSTLAERVITDTADLFLSTLDGQLRAPGR
ncbi:MAG TPA: SIR2 family protein [Acidimicrobiales bacterium]|nr:SIR2 family protein [Acidimicrobiales bacterium]